MPEISIIVPVYKAEAFLPACINSILSQTFSDLEVILVDDGSPDNSGAICEEYAAKDSRVSVIHQDNQGQAAARNHAMTHAKGNWVCFVDSDDLIHPQMVELLHKAAVSSGAGISMCRMLEAVEVPEDFCQTYGESFEVLPMDEATLVKLHDREAYPGWVACAKLIRREYVEQYPFTPGRVYEDNAVVCWWLKEAGKLASIPHPMYFYRGNPESTTKRSFSLKKLDYLWALREIIRFCNASGFSELKSRFAARYAEEAAGCYRIVSYELHRPDVQKTIKKNVRELAREEEVHFTKAQSEDLLDAMHPKLIRFYWPLEGAVRTLKESGISGLVRKGKARLRKGDGE